MNKIDQYVLYSIVSILFINMMATVVLNFNDLSTVLVVTAIIVGALIYNEIFIDNNGGKSIGFLISTLLVIILCIYINIIGNGDSVRVFYFVTIYQVYKRTSRNFAFLWTFIIISIHIYMMTNQQSNIANRIQIAARESILGILIIVIIMLISYVLGQNKKLENMQREVAIKNSEIENAHLELLTAYGKLEEYTAIKERGKIARQMHDTVGHTLTTALVELEVSKMMMDKNKDQATSKISGAIDQVRKGLYDLRVSVKALKDNIDYLSEIDEIIQNTQQHTGVIIKTFIDDDLKVLDKKVLACIYSVLQEGLTNGIRHGRATTFIFKVDLEENIDNTVVRVHLHDNGQGATVFNKGFGAKAMEERVKELKGKIEFEFQKQDGFGIYVEIPIQQY